MNTQNIRWLIVIFMVVVNFILLQYLNKSNRQFDEVVAACKRSQFQTEEALEVADRWEVVSKRWEAMYRACASQSTPHDKQSNVSLAAQ